MPEVKKITTSCNPNVEHRIFDHDEVVPYYKDVFVKLVYVQKNNCQGELIGVHACEKDGTLIENGLIVVLEDGIWKRQPGLNQERLAFIDMDEKGRIKMA